MGDQSHYEQVVNATNYEAAAEALQANGYATVSDEDVATANNFFRDTTAAAKEEKGLDEYSQIYPDDKTNTTPASNS